MTPRDLRQAEVGRCYYVPIVDQSGGMLNDPVLLKLADDRYWLSIADSDLLLYVKGLIIGGGFDAQAFEPDVNPLAIQGPKAEDLMAGEKYNIAPSGPNQIDRIEGGLLGYGNEMTMDNNPLEMGFGKFCNLTGDIDCIGREALLNIQNVQPKRRIRGVTFGKGACPTCSTPWPVYVGAHQVGQITSAICSPRLKTNVGLSLMDADHWDQGTPVSVAFPVGTRHSGAAGVVSNVIQRHEQNELWWRSTIRR
jgi:dimethylsulfoniopropionate demethylase